MVRKYIILLKMKSMKMETLMIEDNIKYIIILMLTLTI